MSMAKNEAKEAARPARVGHDKHFWDDLDSLPDEQADKLIPEFARYVQLGKSRHDADSGSMAEIV